jgi:hypothetical protein
MMPSRLTRALIVVACCSVMLSGCCVTSLKVRKHRACPCESQPGSGLAPIQQGIPGGYDAQPAPVELPPPPAPASASKMRDMGSKSLAMFRATGDKLSGAFDRWN